MTNHFPGTQDKVTLLGRFPSTDEFAAAPPHRAHTDNYHTNTTGGWQHQISQAQAVHKKVPEIKEELKRFGLGAHGKKAELVAHLEEHLSTEPSQAEPSRAEPSRAE